MRECTSWPDHPRPGYPKTRTALLYRNGRAVEFGWRAVSAFNALSAAGRWAQQDAACQLCCGSLSKHTFSVPWRALVAPSATC